MSSRALKAPLVLTTLCLCVSCHAPQAFAFQEAAPTPQQEYAALLEKVKKSDASVDFKHMRQLQTQLDNYEPYGVEDESPMKAFSEGNVERALALAEVILRQNYLDLEAHFAAAVMADSKGDAAAAAHHRYVLKGVLDSILQSGDGNTPDTAYVVIAISEEYAVMHHLGLKVAGQSLLHDDAGHAFDLLQGVDPKSQNQRDVYFNIDPIMKSLDKKFSG